MGLVRDAIQKLLEPGSVSSGGQRSRSYIVGSSIPNYFSARKRDLAKWKNIIAQGGPVTEALECYPRMALSNGYRLESDHDKVRDETQTQLDEMDIEAKIFRLIMDALWAGDAYCEKVPGHGLRRIADLAPIPPDSMEILVDQKGVITGYKQRAGLFGGVEAYFKPEDMMHLRFCNFGEDQYGQSLVGQAYDDIMRDTRTAESIAKAIERHGFKKWHIKVGQPGETLPDATVKKVGREFEDLEVENEMATLRDVDILPLDSEGIPNIAEYSNVMIQRQAAALGVPEEMLGLGRGSTEATANVRLQAFYDKIGWMHKHVARVINNQLLNDMTPRKGMVRWVFNDPNPTDDLIIAQKIQTLMGINQLDPELVITIDEARKMLSMGPKEGA